MSMLCSFAVAYMIASRIFVAVAFLQFVFHMLSCLTFLDTQTSFGNDQDFCLCFHFLAHGTGVFASSWLTFLVHVMYKMGLYLVVSYKWTYNL